MAQPVLDLKALFIAALDHEPGPVRAAYLAGACGQDTAMQRKVEALLAAHDRADEVLGPAAPAASNADIEPTLGANPATAADATQTASSELASRTVEYTPIARPDLLIAGRYTLQEKVGEGGMGEVWVAKQSEPVKRKVALKLIKPGMDSRAVLQRFEQERQALALMDHPNIARVLDGGLTPTSQPFFVMELVNGLPLTKFCDEARLTPRERLELFVPICQAVQHAHQKGIVHRDLKPANVLVTLIDGKPVPKVIDFGVAKATAGRLTDETMSTQFGAVVGTLDYMSPEQAGFAGEDIDTRADIYSLGVILYELLTGLRPIDSGRLKKAALNEMIRIIREEEPSKPSTRLSTDASLPSMAALRQTEPRKLMTILRGELDWVVMKCLEKRRDRRYETANGLARDIQRYLADQPVEARPPSTGYRLGKFLKRNKGPVLAASLLLLALLGGIAGTTFGLIRAEGQRRLALAAEQTAAEQRAEAVAERDRAIEAERQTAVERDKAVVAERQTAVERDKAVAAEAKSKAINDFLTQDLLTQAEPANNAAEDHVTLLEVLDRAAEKVGERFKDQPEVEAALRETIYKTYHGLGAWEKAETQLRALLDGARKLDPISSKAYGAQGELAHLLRHRGRIDGEVLRMAEEAAEGLERTLGPDHSETLTALNNLALAYRDEGKLTEATALIERVSEAKIAKLGPDHPETLPTLNNLAVAYRAAGKLPEAIALFERVRDAEIAKLGPDHPHTLTALNNLAGAYQAVGKIPDAIALFERVRDAEIAKLGPDHPDTLQTINDLAVAYQAAGRLPEATDLFERVRDARIAKLGPDHSETLRTLNNLAEAYRSTERLTEAIALNESVREARIAKFGPHHPDTLATLNNLAVSYLEGGRVPEATTLLERVGDARFARLGPDHPDTLTTLNNLAVAYKAAGRLPEAIALFERVRDARIAKLGPDNPETLRTLAELSGAYITSGRLTEAEPLLCESLERLRAKPGPDGSQLASTLASLSLCLLHQEKWTDAEPLIRECLTIREKTQPDAWSTFNSKSQLGGALLGQQKYAEAEPLLLAGYEGMKEREATIPPQGKDRLTEALERLVLLYKAIDRPEEAARWRAELEAKKPEAEPSGK